MDLHFQVEQRLDRVGKCGCICCFEKEGEVSESLFNCVAMFVSHSLWLSFFQGCGRIIIFHRGSMVSLLPRYMFRYLSLFD